MRLAHPTFALALLVAGCSGEGLPGDKDDGGTVGPDLAALPDLARRPDLVMVKSGIGDPCTSQGFPSPGDCKDEKKQICLPEGFGFQDGYCTQSCSGTDPCPSDAKCIRAQGNMMACFLICKTNADCRGPDYQCSQQSGVCFPYDDGGGVRPATNNGAACVLPVIDPGFGLKGPFGANVSASGTSGIQAECALSVDPTNKNIVVAWNDLGNQGFLGTSHSGDDGKTFGKPLLLPMDKMVDMNSDQSDPVTAVDKLGNFWISWVGFNRSGGGNPNNMHMFAARSTNGGVTFPEVFQTSPNTEWVANSFIDKPWIAIGSDGTVWMTWNRSTQQRVDIRMVRSTDNGKTWSMPVTISDSLSRGSAGRNLAQIAIGTDNKPVVVWVELYDEQYGSTDNEVYIQRLDADGKKNGPNVLVSRGTDSPTFDDPSVAIFGNQNVYVGFVSGTSSGVWDVRVAASQDGGAKFGPSVKVNDDKSCATHFHHQIAVDGKGNVHAIWFDNRYLTGNVFHASSGPADAMNPVKFGVNTFVNDTPFEFTTRRDMSNWLGDYLGLTVVGSAIYAAWTDARTNNRSHIWFAKGALK
ncbi:MAG: exo-alpha-sialidase [Myxococcales bacterium]|nr:exo-alpha-sialidase [Myxococcales bacterium]